MIRPVRSSKAFTMLELIVVIVILGILAAIAVPTFAKVIEKSKKSSLDSTLSAVDRNARALAGFDQSAVTKAHLDTATGEALGAGTYVVAADASTVTLTKDSLCRQLTVVQGGPGTLGNCSAVSAAPGDTFDRPDSTTGLGTSSSGLVWTATPYNPGFTVGTLGITSNTAYQVTAGSDAWSAATVDLGGPARELKVSTTGTGAGLIFRHQDIGNKYVTYIYQDLIEVGKYTAGSGYQPLTARVAVPAGGGELKVVDSGTVIEVYYQGTLYHTLTTSEFATATQVGVGLHNSGTAKLDNFIAVK